MPRRQSPDPLAEAIGHRIRQLRKEAGLTLEALAYESDQSKGYLSDVERGLARPSVATLQKIAEHLDVLLLDLVTFPEQDTRQKLVDALRGLSLQECQSIDREVESLRDANIQRTRDG